MLFSGCFPAFAVTVNLSLVLQDDPVNSAQSHSTAFSLARPLALVALKRAVETSFVTLHLNMEPFAYLFSTSL